MPIRPTSIVVTAVVAALTATAPLALAWAPCSMHPWYGNAIHGIRVDWEGRCGDRRWGDIDFSGNPTARALECWYQAFKPCRCC